MPRTHWVARQNKLETPKEKDEEKWEIRECDGRVMLASVFIVYYESMKRELKTRPLYECRWDERLKTEAEESTRLAYTVLIGELEYLKIETRLIDEMFASVMGEYVFLKW